MKFSDQFVSEDFCLTAEVTSLSVESDVTGHLRPPIAPQDQFKGFPLARVPCDMGVMVLFNYVALEVLAFWDINFASEQKESVCCF
jgi:hypothetical protein